MTHPAAICSALTILTTFTLAGPASARDDSDPRLLAEIARIRAIDNHTHDGARQGRCGIRWVPYADPLLWPFAGDKSRLFYSGGPSSVAQLQRELSLATLPATLDAYVTQLLEPTLARWQSSSAAAVKFLSAYARALDFQTVAADVAAAAHAKGATGAALDPVQTKAVGGKP